MRASSLPASSSSALPSLSPFYSSPTFSLRSTILHLPSTLYSSWLYTISSSSSAALSHRSRDSSTHPYVIAGIPLYTHSQRQPDQCTSSLSLSLSLPFSITEHSRCTHLYEYRIHKQKFRLLKIHLCVPHILHRYFIVTGTMRNPHVSIYLSIHQPVPTTPTAWDCLGSR